jgi:hypothetical protein
VNLFRSEEHLRAWWVQASSPAGAGTPVAEAFELGRRVFGGLLTEFA